MISELTPPGKIIYPGIVQTHSERFITRPDKCDTTSCTGSNTAARQEIASKGDSQGCFFQVYSQLFNHCVEGVRLIFLLLILVARDFHAIIYQTPAVDTGVNLNGAGCFIRQSSQNC